MKEIIKKAEEFALSEIKKYGTPMPLHFDIANQKGLELSRKIGGDPDIIQVGTRLMDIKLGEALSRGRVQEHIRMGSDAAKNFLAQFDLPKEKVQKTINCIEGHHRTVNWTCKEAEICANADCYRFLTVRGWTAYINLLGSRSLNFDQNMKAAEAKLEEKWKILSLDACKKELEPDYKLIKQVIQRSKVFSQPK